MIKKDHLKLFEGDLVPLSLEDVKEYQRTITKVINMKLGYDGMNTVSISPISDAEPCEWTRWTELTYKENEMRAYVDDCDCTDKPERDYLSGRLADVRWAKKNEARRHFGISDDEPPCTAQEIVDRILEGQYVLDDKTKNFPDSTYYAVGKILWRDPKKKRDEKGLKAFEELLGKAETETRDRIMVNEPADGLKALREFEDLPVQ